MRLVLQKLKLFGVTTWNLFMSINYTFSIVAMMVWEVLSWVPIFMSKLGLGIVKIVLGSLQNKVSLQINAICIFMGVMDMFMMYVLGI